MFFRNKLLPEIISFMVGIQTFGFITSKNRYIKIFFVDFINIGQKFPCPFDGFFFKIIAKRPVTQHFEHGVVVGIVTNFFKVIVFSGNAKAFLRIGNPMGLKVRSFPGTYF